MSESENPFGDSGSDDELMEMEITEHTAGTHKATLTAVSKGASKASGNPMYTWVWKVDGAHTVYDYTMLPPQGITHAAKIMRARGVEKGDNGKFSCRPADLIGKACMVRTVIEESAGYDPSPKIKAYSSADGANADDTNIPF